MSRRTSPGNADGVPTLDLSAERSVVVGLVSDTHGHLGPRLAVTSQLRPPGACRLRHPRWLVCLARRGLRRGGESVVDDATQDDCRETLFYGGSAGVAIDRRSSVQIAHVGSRVQTDIGSDTDNIGLGYSIRF